MILGPKHILKLNQLAHYIWGKIQSASLCVLINTSHMKLYLKLYTEEHIAIPYMVFALNYTTI